MTPKVTTEFNKGNAEIFKSKFLERLTKTNLTTSIVVYGLTVLGLIYVSVFVKNTPVNLFLGLFFFAFFFWTLAEYLLHRYLFHWITDNKYVKRFHFIMHGAHHLYPNDTDRLLMPPVPGLLMGAVLFGFFYIIFSIIGYPVYTWGFFAGFFLGYLLYSFVHRATHVMKTPKTFGFIWHHHALHHYKYPDKCFGVSSPIWDYVFRTMPPKKK